MTRPPCGTFLPRIVELLLPRACLACGLELAELSAPIGLCRRCHGRFQPLDPRRRCRRCLRPLPLQTSRLPCCLDCAARPSALDRIAAAWSYREPLRSVMHALKFRRLDFLAEALTEEALAREPLASFDPFDCVVPVPLALWRRLQRGFDQADRIARCLARHADRPLVRALARSPLAARRQSRLGRAERQSNSSLGLRLRPAVGSQLAGRSALLVDDIVTTGSTFAACAALLRRAGACRVAAFALAATPRVSFGERVELLDRLDRPA